MTTPTFELAPKFEAAAMNTSNLRRSERYARYHQARSNLLLHIVFVPLFLTGNVALLFALIERRWLVAVGAAVLTFVSLAMQGRGHRGEPVMPEPFTGPLNAVTRILREQWLSFPRFVFSGAWSQALRRAAGSTRRG